MRSKPKTLQELATALGATLQGDPQCRISGLASLEKAKEGDLSFLTNSHYRQYLGSTKASAVIVAKEEASLCQKSLLITDNPRFCLVKAAHLFAPEDKILPGIHPTAIIGKDCIIPKSASIGPYCVLGNHVVLEENVILETQTILGDHCHIGSNTQFKPRVTLYKQVKVGSNCLLHSGVVLGSDGFGYAQHEGEWIKMPHLASVTIGNNVEIGANTTIDSGVLEDTYIGNGVIIDNLVQIGHNVTIGDKTAIAGVAAIAGSTQIGKECLIGGGARVGGHIEITDKVYLTATTGVNRSITQSGTYSAGLPARPNAEWRKSVARFQYLEDMAKRIRALEKQVGITPVRKVEDE